MSIFLPSRTPLIGAIVLGASITIAAVLFFARKRGRSVALNPNVKIRCKLIEREEISHDTRRFRYAVPNPEHILGLPVGKHIMISTTLEGKLESRAYTPISSDDEVGYFDLLIKVYFKNTHPKFPEGGKITQYLEGLQLGDHIDVLGPKGCITYLGHGRFQVEDKRNRKNPPTFRQCSTIGMIAGGSGITPMLQVIRAILKDPLDKTTVTLLFGNQTEHDILLREELERCAKDPRVKLWYTLDRPANNWTYSSGFVNEDMLREHFVPFTPDTQVLMCGPPPMLKFACIPNLEKLGFDANHYLEF
jgi:cytochrome-b5 reductase